jgi:hypothetical protein
VEKIYINFRFKVIAYLKLKIIDIKIHDYNLYLYPYVSKSVKLIGNKLAYSSPNVYLF